MENTHNGTTEKEYLAEADPETYLNQEANQLIYLQEQIYDRFKELYPLLVIASDYDYEGWKNLATDLVYYWKEAEDDAKRLRDSTSHADTHALMIALSEHEGENGLCSQHQGDVIIDTIDMPNDAIWVVKIYAAGKDDYSFSWFIPEALEIEEFKWFKKAIQEGVEQGAKELGIEIGF